MTKILFVPIHPTSLSAMLDLADALGQINTKSDFLLSTPYLQENELKIKSHGHGCKISRKSYEHRSPRKIEKAWTKLGRIFPLARKLNIFWLSLNLRFWPQIERRLLKVIEHENYNSVVFLGDRHLGIEPMFLDWCYQKKIGIVIAPLMIKDDGHHALEIRRSSKFDVTDNLSFQKKFPNQIKKDLSSQRIYSFYTPFITEVLAQAKLLSSAPWIIGGSGKGIVCVDGEYERRRAIENGINTEKIQVTGQAVHDYLYRNIKVKGTRNSLGLPTVLLSMPQYAEQRTLSESDHWKEVRWMLKILAELPARILISLHPKMDRSKYTGLILEYGFQILEGPLYKHIHEADIFLAINSSTHLWASLCNIPAVLMNFYELDDSPFRQMKGIEIVSDKSKLSDLLHQMCQNPVYYRQLKEAQAKYAQQISPFDGKCLERISSLLSNHLQSRHF